MRWLLLFTAFLGFHPLIAEEKNAQKKNAEQKYNVVLIYTDDMGYGDLGCYGHPSHRTPHLDRLAWEGVRFTQFYVAQAVCSASRAALLTGCYPNRIGILGALDHTSQKGISREETTLAGMLKSIGYRTACFGKWHLGHHAPFLPTNHGFDEYAGIPYSNDMWPRHPNAKAGYPELPWIVGDKTVELDPDQNQFTTRLTRLATDFISRHAKQPFFLYLAHPMPHVPLHVARERRGQSAEGLYGDVIEEIDWSTGEILAELKKQGLDEKTLVIFASDNGPWLSYGNHAGSAGGLREGKGTTFEGGIRVPCLARLPGIIPAGLRCDQPAMTIDILPTLANLLSAPMPTLPIDGKDIWPLFTKPAAPSPHEVLYFYWNQELQAVRSGPWKLHFPHNFRALKLPAGKDGRPSSYGTGTIELSLFDLENDPAEQHNRVEQEPAVVQALMKKAELARRELGDSLTKREGTATRPPGNFSR